MSTLKIPATDRSPEIDFDFHANRFSMRGESYPEDVTEFYGPVMDRLESHLKGLQGAEVRFAFELIYFNSSSAKVLMSLFELLDAAAAAGNHVTIDWYHDTDDDNMQELGEEFGEDLEHAHFNLVVTSPA